MKSSDHESSEINNNNTSFLVSPFYVSNNNLGENVEIEKVQGVCSRIIGDNLLRQSFWYY